MQEAPYYAPLLFSLYQKSPIIKKALQNWRTSAIKYSFYTIYLRFLCA